LTVIGLAALAPGMVLIDGTVVVLGAGAGVAGVLTMGAVVLASTPVSMALRLVAGRTRGLLLREATVVERRVVVRAAGVVWVRVTVVCCCVVLEVVSAAAGVGVGAAASVAAGARGAGVCAAVGPAAVFSATWLVELSPGVSWVMPLSCGWVAYQATPPMATSATKPAAIAPGPMPPRRASVRVVRAA
jgi:hypothetical protein